MVRESTCVHAGSAEAERWKEVMDLAEKHGFITQAYGGTAILMTHENQKKVGIWRQTQIACGRIKSKGKTK